MLTEFSIGNYQAFSTPQRVPLRPITLIFGPNSAGKSALLRSLLVARHAILNAKLSKSEGASERHPGSYADIVRNGNTNPISFGFTVQPDGKSGEEAHKLGLVWKETLAGNLETVALSVKQMHSEVVTYSTNCDSKHLQINYLGENLRELIASARLDSDAKGILNELVQNSIKKRLSLQKNVAIPGIDEDHFRIEDSKSDEGDVFNALEKMHEEGRSNEGLSDWMRKIKTAVDSLKSAITSQFKLVDSSVRAELTNLIYHGPIRPICDEITKAQQLEPGMKEWWSLAADPKLLAKVNEWLSKDVFKTKFRLEFDRLFLDSALKELLRMLSKERTIEHLIAASIDAKLGAPHSNLEGLTSDMAGCLSDDDYEDEGELWEAAEQRAREVLSDQYEEEYQLNRDEGNVEEAEAFLLGGVNAILSNLQGVLESVREGKGARSEGGFNSAKVCFFDLGAKCVVSPSNMGIGFSQMMPLVASAFGSENQLIAIEQPELHVHPALQTELADLFIQSAKERGNRFLIETHSEHLILRVMRRIRETFEDKLPEGMKPITTDDVCVLYVEPGENGSIVREMPLNERGELVKGWPGGFFEEALNEMF